MEVEAQSKIDLLLNKKAFTTSFENTLDTLQGDGQQLLNEFVDWPVAGDVYSYSELKNELCGDAKFKFDPARIWPSGLVWSYTDSKKAWTSRTMDLEAVDFQRHPKHWIVYLKLTVKPLKSLTSKDHRALKPLTTKHLQSTEKRICSGNSPKMKNKYVNS